jgi:predicted NBD/HSP70 family sugar kinase
MRGATGNAGEFGHVVVRSRGRPCFCGNVGCLEAYVSSHAVVANYRDATGQSTSVLDYEGVCHAAAAGDEAARRVLEEAGELLADAAVSLVNLFDVDELVLCGRSFRHVVELYGELVEQAVNARSIARSLRTVKVRASRMGDPVAAVGAACLVLDSQLRA